MRKRTESDRLRAVGFQNGNKCLGNEVLSTMKSYSHILICVFLFLVSAVATAQEEAAENSLCEGTKEVSLKKHSLLLTSSQLSILEYDRKTELLYFNVYKGIFLTPTFQLSLGMSGLAFAMTPKEALTITRLYSMGVYKIELLFVKKSGGNKGCRKDKSKTHLEVLPLRVALVDGKGRRVKQFLTKKGRNLNAQKIHTLNTYENAGKPSVIVEIEGEKISFRKKQKLRSLIEKPLRECYQQALEKNGRFQGSIIFRFHEGKTRAVHSNKNLLFGNCVTKSIEAHLSISFENKLLIRTIFRLERK